MLEGSITNGVHHLSMRVYYEDTDFSGYVYHANYLKFCERARSDMLRRAGRGPDMPCLKADDRSFVVLRKRRVIFCGLRDLMMCSSVESVCRTMTGARFEMLQRVLRGDDVLFTAEVTAVLD